MWSSLLAVAVAFAAKNVEAFETECNYFLYVLVGFAPDKCMATQIKEWMYSDMYHCDNTENITLSRWNNSDSCSGTPMTYTNNEISEALGIPSSFFSWKCDGSKMEADCSRTHVIDYTVNDSCTDSGYEERYYVNDVCYESTFGSGSLYITCESDEGTIHQFKDSACMVNETIDTAESGCKHNETEHTYEKLELTCGGVLAGYWVHAVVAIFSVMSFVL